MNPNCTKRRHFTWYVEPRAHLFNSWKKNAFLSVLPTKKHRWTIVINSTHPTFCWNFFFILYLYFRVTPRNNIYTHTKLCTKKKIPQQKGRVYLSPKLMPSSTFCWWGKLTPRYHLPPSSRHSCVDKHQSFVNAPSTPHKRINMFDPSLTNKRPQHSPPPLFRLSPSSSLGGVGGQW